MKTLLIALPNDKLGGAELYLKNIANFYLSSGYSVFVLFLLREKYYGWSDYKAIENSSLIYTNSSSEKFGLFSFIKSLWCLRRLNFDYVYTSHVHLTGIIGLFVKLKILNKQYFIGRESTLIFERFSGFKLFLFKLFINLGYSELDLLICQTFMMEKQFVINQPRLSKKIKIRTIFNPINLESIDLRMYSEAVCYENFIVAAGRLIPEKGFDVLINAFSKLHSDFPNLKLVILGEGKCSGLLESQIFDLKLFNSVYLHGFVKNVYPYFSAAKLCVVSSRIEGFPNVLLQMMSQNNSVVSTKCAGGIDEIKGLFLSETNSAESLYTAMKNCLLFERKSIIRNLFDRELEGRSVFNFINTINNEVLSSTNKWNL